MVALAGLLFFIQIMRAKQITIKQNPTALIATTATFIPPSNSELVFGNPGAPITITEFMDFNCKECLSMHEIIKSEVASHPQEMRLIWKDAPRPKIFSPDVSLAHQAGWCVAQQDQNKFWQFVDTAIQNTNNLQEVGLKNIAQGLNLNTDKWWQCTTGNAAKQNIAAGTQLLSQLGIPALPAIFVNNKLINTNANINLKEMLESFIVK